MSSKTRQGKHTKEKAAFVGSCTAWSFGREWFHYKLCIRTLDSKRLFSFPL